MGTPESPQVRGERGGVGAEAVGFCCVSGKSLVSVCFVLSRGGLWQQQTARCWKAGPPQGGEEEESTVFVLILADPSSFVQSSCSLIS